MVKRILVNGFFLFVLFLLPINVGLTATDNEKILTPTGAVLSKPNETETQMKHIKESFSVPINFLMGRIDPEKHPDFSAIKATHSIRKGMYMHQEAYIAFQQMYEAAKLDGVSLIIVSAFRDFNHQRRIWNNKWNGRSILTGNIKATEILDPFYRALEILKYSAMPGTSRHHWGTDIDINSVDNAYFETTQGRRVYSWLVENAGRFGFYQPYTSRAENRSGGYEEEKWHWSYHTLSSKYLDAYAKIITYDQLIGFNGHQLAEEIRVIENYVMNVNMGSQQLASITPR